MGKKREAAAAAEREACAALVETSIPNVDDDFKRAYANLAAAIRARGEKPQPIPGTEQPDGTAVYTEEELRKAKFHCGPGLYSEHGM